MLNFAQPFFFYFLGVYGGNYGANYRLYKFQGDRFDPCNSNMIKKLSNMQFELHDGNGGTCPLSEDLIISVRGMKSRRNGNFKRYVTYYVSLHPALQWLTKIALGTIYVLRQYVFVLFGPHSPTLSAFLHTTFFANILSKIGTFRTIFIQNKSLFLSAFAHHSVPV